jgi:hypothetical protein
MMDSIYNQYEDVCKVLEEKNSDDSHMDGISKVYMKELIDILKPFQVATDALQADAKPTLYKVHLQYYKMKTACSALPTDNYRQKVLKKRLLHYLDSIYLNETRIEHKIALFLHPTFHQLRMLDNKEKRQIHAAVTAELEDITFVDNEDPQPPPAKKQKKSSDSDNYSEWADVANGTGGQKDELQEYIDGTFTCKKEGDVLQWWQQHEAEFPALAILAKKYHAIPASSASSERSFSAAGMLVNKRRSCIGTDNVDDLLFIHDNYSN